MDNISNKVLRGENSIYNRTSSITYIRYGVVKYIEGEGGNTTLNRGLGRIKVYIKGPISQGCDGETQDNLLTENEINSLPWCFPMLPKHLSVTPKIGEVVLVMYFNDEKQHVDRLYLGPIISQLDLLDKDPYPFTPLRGFTFGPQEANVNVDLIPELKGVFPKPDEISIQGRNNTDITQKNNEIVIRAGKFEPTTPNVKNPYKFKFNSRTQAFIQIKNDVDIVLNDEVKKGTVTNIVANKINLITHESGSPRFNVTNQDNLISDEELQNILNTAHQVPFGDVLLQYLILMKEALFNHVHNGSGNVATDLTSYGNKQSIALFKSKANELENSMLSKNIRIN